jgi:hypothetical protein
LLCNFQAFAVCIATCQSRPSQNDGSVFVVYPEPIAKYYVDHTESMRFMPSTTKRVPTTRKLSLNALSRDEKHEKLAEKYAKSEPAELRTFEDAKLPWEFDAVAMSNMFNVTEASKSEQTPVVYDSKISAVLLGLLNETVADSPDKKEDYSSFINQTISNIVGMATLVNDMAPMPEQANDESLFTMMTPTFEPFTTLTNEMMDTTEAEVTTVTEGIESETVTNESPM